MFQTNLILPEPCAFLNPSLPACSVIRPTLSQSGGPIAAARGFVADNLFVGQPAAFTQMLLELAAAAGAAQRQIDD